MLGWREIQPLFITCWYMVVIDGHVFLCLTSMVVALLKQVTVLFLNRHFRGKCMCLWGRFACEKCPFSFFLSYFSTKSPQPKMALGMTYRSLPGRHLVSRQMSPMGKKRNWRLAGQYTRLLALFLLQVGASVCSQNWPLISPHVQQLGCSMKFVYVYFLPKKWGGFLFSYRHCSRILQRPSSSSSFAFLWTKYFSLSWL